ncbi:MAG: glycoside hydrolase family 3 N-terminal domain-containing protein [Acidimicrobiia bacterium]|nr:glycoside hydrolase family 3 N-terminal domain-containing protein [Acidimicrobiia bacterium]
MFRVAPHRALTIGMSICLLLAACGSTTAVDSIVDSSSAVEPTVVEPAMTTVEAVVTTTEPVPTTTTTTTPPRSALECASDIALEVRLGQLLFPVVVQSELDAAASLAERGLIGGVVVLGNPTAAISDDIETLQARSMVSPSIVAVDEEGGRVQRLEALVGAQPSARAVAEQFTPSEARARASAHAAQVAALGFTMNLAPVVDLDNGGFIRDRSFGSDVDEVTDYAFATADGIRDGGLTPVVKHFPGHGRGEDSHTGLPTLPDFETIRETDLVPFVRAVERGDIPIMVGHLVVRGLTNGKPATLSSEAIDGLLRTDMGFDGLVMTDALNMDAIADSMNNAEAAEQSLRAGIDLVMLGNLADSEATIEQLSDAVRSGRLDEQTVNESFLRVLDERQIELCSLAPELLPAIGCQPDIGGCAAG